ncbi:MAG: hypothetical protein ABIG32_01355 [Candidatus Uhrbacteria bacterium]|nr:hypothetical protein [Patescibacteria group bacterium]MBU1907153.1 hypothetical protein [Patescibacteria group bacterium]
MPRKEKGQKRICLNQAQYALLYNAYKLSVLYGVPGQIPSVLLHFLSNHLISEKAGQAIKPLRNDGLLRYTGQCWLVIVPDIDTSVFEEEGTGGITSGNLRNLLAHWKRGERSFTEYHLQNPPKEDDKNFSFGEVAKLDTAALRKAVATLKKEPTGSVQTGNDQRVDVKPRVFPVVSEGIPTEIIGQILADHMYLEELNRGPLPQKESGLVFFWHCGSHERVHAVMNGLQQMSLYEADSVRRVTPLGRELVEAIGAEPTMSEEEARETSAGIPLVRVPFTPLWLRQKRQQIARRQDASGDGEVQKDVRKARKSRGKNSTSLEEIMADHILLEELYGGMLPSHISTALFKTHRAGSKNPSMFRSHMKRQGFFETYDQAGNKINKRGRRTGNVWTVTVIGRDLIEQGQVEPVLTEEEAQKLIDGKTVKIKQANNQSSSDLVDDRPAQATHKRTGFVEILADHVLMENVHGGPLPSKLSLAIFSKHRPNRRYQAQVRNALRREGVLESAPPSLEQKRGEFFQQKNRGRPGHVWAVSGKGYEQISECKAEPTMSGDQARDLLDVVLAKHRKANRMAL